MKHFDGEKYRSRMREMKEKFIMSILRRGSTMDEGSGQDSGGEITSTTIPSTISTTTPSAPSPRAVTSLPNPPTTVTTTTPTTPSQPAELLSMLAKQGPQVFGLGLASIAYTGFAALPYWLPAIAGK